MRKKLDGETKKHLNFRYSRPTEQMGIAIVYGGLDDIFSMMDNDDLRKAVDDIIKKVADDEWDLFHFPSKTGLGGRFKLVWYEK